MKFRSIADVVREYGVKNVVVILPMTPLEMVGIIPGIAFKSLTGEQHLVTASICESRYTVAEGYKITLTANDVRFAKEHFYISDLDSLIRERGYRVCVLNDNGYTEVVIE